MRRSSVSLLVAVLVLLGVTHAHLDGAVEAAGGDPGDACTQAPDYPLGWRFRDACRVHDACIDGLDIEAILEAHMESRLECDTQFQDDLLDASHTAGPVICADNLVCRSLARTYYLVVRFVTERLVPVAAG